VPEAATICPSLCKLTFDLLTLKVVSESRVAWATSVPILVFLGLSVLDSGPLYATDRRQTDKQTDVRHASSLNASALRGRGHKKRYSVHWRKTKKNSIHSRITYDRKSRSTDLRTSRRFPTVHHRYSSRSIARQGVLLGVFHPHFDHLRLLDAP